MKRHAKTNEALEEVDLTHVLDMEGLDYKETWGRSGMQLNVRSCPFCGNNKYKVYINAESGLGNCFAGSCSQGTFNKWQFLKQVYDLSPSDLQVKINRLAAEQGWRPKPIAVARHVPADVNLPNNTKVVDLHALPKYLLGRGVTPDVADYFDLRWCEKGTFVTKAPDGTRITQDYSQRILIPVYDLHGEMVTFQGRDATGTAERRYLFPAMMASTGSHLYNINNFQHPQDTVVISEGVFDVVAVKQALDKQGLSQKMLALGSFGMQFSINPSGSDQLAKLMELKRRGIKKVIFLWDNEAPAIRNAIKAANSLRKYGFEVAVAKLAKSKDPGEADLDEIGMAIIYSHPVRSDLDTMLLAQRLTGL